LTIGAKRSLFALLLICWDCTKIPTSGKTGQKWGTRQPPVSSKTKAPARQGL